MTRVLLLLMTLMFSLSLRAETAERRPPGPPFFQLAEALNLSDAQLAPVRAILQSQHEEMQALREAGRAQHEALRSRMHARYAAILNPEQMQLLTEFEENHRPPPPEPRSADRPPPRHGSTPPTR